MADELDRILNELRDELKGLSRVLKSTFKIFDQGNNSEKAQQEQIAKQNKQMLELLYKHNRISKKDYELTLKEIDGTKKKTSAIGKATKKVLAFGDSLDLATKGSLKDLGKGFIETGKNFMMADRKIEGFSDALKGFDGLQLFGVKLSDLGKTLDFNVGIFKTMSQTGAGFGKSVIQLRNAATAANMPILDFVDLIQSNSQVFAKLFGSIMDGMPTIQSFALELRNRTKNELAEFGLNMDETTEFLATQLEIQRATGNSDKIRQMNLVQTTVEYAKNLSKLSKLTGINVMELDEQNRQAALNGNFMASLHGLNKEQAANVRQVNAAMEKSNPEFAQVFKNVVQFGVATTDAGIQLSNLTNGRSTDAINELVNGTISVNEFYAKTGEAFNSLNTQLAKDVAMAGSMNMSGANEALNIMAAGARATSETVDAQMKAHGDNTKSIVAFGETIDTMKVQSESISTDVFDTILNSAKLGEMLDFIGGAVEGLAGQSVLDNVFDGVNALRVTIKSKVGEFVNKAGTEEGWGKGTIFSTADDSVFGMSRRAGERYGEGGQGNSLVDILTPWDTLAEQLAKIQNNKTAPLYYSGSDGFQNFGSGTPATLHGIESVVPKNDIGQLIKTMQGFTNLSGNTTESTSAGTGNTDTYLKELVELNKNAQRALNTLVTLGAMTEKNTKNTKNNLANMGGSLV